VTTRLAAATDILHLRRATGYLGTSCGSSSTIAPTPRVRVPRHLAWLVARLVARLVVDYCTYATRPGDSAPRVVRRAARRRLLRVRRASMCLGTSRSSSCGSSRHSSSTTSPTPHDRMLRHVTRLVDDYFTYAARPGASARRATRHAARRRLLHLRRASGCLGTSRGSSHGTSRGSLSTTSPTPRVRVPRHLARLVALLVVDYFAYATRSGASSPRTTRRLPCIVLPLDFSSVGRTGSCRAPGRPSRGSTTLCVVA
jgi:hypothetical protein